MAFSRDDVGSRGFAQIDVIVALAVLAMMIAAVANLTNTTRRGLVHIERNFAEVEIVGGLVAVPTARDDIAALSSKGQLDGHVWRLAAEPFRAPFSPIGRTPRWVPAKIELSVRGRSGALFKLEMVRLVRSRTP
jgi:hypothetical protein